MARTATSTKSRSRSAEPELTLAPDLANQVVLRLARVEGQVRAIQRMINERRDCHVIVHQMAAARAALERATVQLMVNNLAQCIQTSSNGASANNGELKRLTETFIKLL